MARATSRKEVAEPTAPELAESPDPRVTIAEGDDLVEIEIRDCDLSGIDASHARLVRSQLHTTPLTASRLRSVGLVDVLVGDGEFSGADLHEASLLRVEFRNCRMTGVSFSEAEFRHVRFVACKLDDANLRMARLDHVWFEDCSLVEADLAGASLGSVRMDRCDLDALDVSQAVATSLDLRGSRFESLRGASGLRAVRIGADQVMPFALGVFAETGVRID